MSRTLLPLILLVVIAFILVFGNPSAQGQAPEVFEAYLPLVDGPPPVPPAWIGPDGGYIVAVAVAPSQPSTVYAGTWGSGIFKSSDDGATWAWKSQGLSMPYINSLAVDPQNHQIVYAGTYTGKLYKTVDGGESWFQSSTNIQEEAIVYSIAINPNNPNKIYIGTRGISNNGSPPWAGVLYRTSNGGDTWIPALMNVAGPSDQDWAYGVALHPQNPSWIYAATHEHGVYRSTDGGRNWQPVNKGITNYSSRGIVVAPHSPLVEPTVYMGAWKYAGVFKSIDGGENWFHQSSSNGMRIYSMSIDPQNSQNVYASVFPGGVLKTTNGGDTWFITGLNSSEVVNTAVNPSNPKILYSGTNGDGLFMSADRGGTWQLRQNGLHATRVSDLGVSPLDSERLFAGVYHDGVFQSLDRGQNWGQLGTSFGERKILGVAVSPGNTHQVFALTDAAGLYRCDLQPGGTCWQQIEIQYSQMGEAQPAFSANHPFARPALIEDAPEPQRAPDAAPPLLALAFAPGDPQIAYLGTSGNGVYKSLDGGDTWNPVGLPGAKIVSLSVDTADARHVFASTETAVWSTNDGGAHWIDTGLSGVTIYDLALDGAGILYTGTNDGVYLYNFLGWIHLALPGVTVTAIGTHPMEPGWLYAGTLDGLRTSRDAGQSWVAAPPELDGVAVDAVSFDPVDPDWVYVSTPTHGVMRIKAVE